MDLYISEHRDPNREPVEMSRSLKVALFSDGGYLQALLPSDRTRRLEADSSERPERTTARDPGVLRTDLEAVRSLVIDRNDELPIVYLFTWAGLHGWFGSGVVVPFRGVDFTNPSERRAQLDADHSDPDRRGQIRVVYLRPHPDAVRWARRYRDRSWLERKRDRARSAWLLATGPIPNAMGGTPDPPEPRFEEESAERVVARPAIDVLGERVEVEWRDAIAQCIPSLDRAIALCEKAERAGRPVFWTYS